MVRRSLSIIRFATTTIAVITNKMTPTTITT
jgi:hypothetical protein